MLEQGLVDGQHKMDFVSVSVSVSESVCLSVSLILTLARSLARSLPCMFNPSLPPSPSLSLSVRDSSTHELIVFFPSQHPPSLPLSHTHVSMASSPASPPPSFP